MRFGFRRDRDRWATRVSDLPGRGDLLLAPELADLADNPVFRRTRQRRRAFGLWRGRDSLLLLVALAYFLSMVGPARSFRTVSPFLYLAALILIPRIYRGKPETTVAGLSVREWADLADCGYSPRDAAIGAWGAVATSGRGRALALWGIGLLAAAFAFFRFGSVSPGGLVWAFVPCLFYFHMLVLRLGNPHASLAGMRVRIRHEGRAGLGAFPPLSHLNTAGGRAGCLFVLVGFALVFVFGLGGWLSPATAIAGGSAVGALMGLAFRRGSVRDARENLDALERDFRTVMEAACRAVRPDDMK